MFIKHTTFPEITTISSFGESNTVESLGVFGQVPNEITEDLITYLGIVELCRLNQASKGNKHSRRH